MKQGLLHLQQALVLSKNFWCRSTQIASPRGKRLVETLGSCFCCYQGSHPTWSVLSDPALQESDVLPQPDHTYFTRVTIRRMSDSLAVGPADPG